MPAAHARARAVGCSSQNSNARRPTRGIFTQPRRRERRKTEPDQDRRGDGYRRAKAGGSFEESAECEGNQQHLQAAVRRHSPYRLLQGPKGPRRHRQPIHEDDIEHDPTDRKKTDDRLQYYRAQPAESCRAKNKSKGSRDNERQPLHRVSSRADLRGS